MVVRFKLDENLPRDAAALLRDAGHAVQTVLDERLGCNPDPEVLEVLDACRIWVLRPHTQSIDNTLVLLKGALVVLDTESVHARLWIIEPGQVRIRQ